MQGLTSSVGSRCNARSSPDTRSSGRPFFDHVFPSGRGTGCNFSAKQGQIQHSRHRLTSASIDGQRSNRLHDSISKDRSSLRCLAKRSRTSSAVDTNSLDEKSQRSVQGDDGTPALSFTRALLVTFAMMKLVANPCTIMMIVCRPNQQYSKHRKFATVTVINSSTFSG